MHRTNNFDALRLLAAIAVIFGHAHPLTKSLDLSLLGSSVQAVAVKVFFVISGYLICTSWSLQPSAIPYLQKRALRIFPALVVLCLLTVFIAGPLITDIPLRTYFGYAHTYYYLVNVLLRPVYDLPGLFQFNPYPIAVNGSLWSLPVEFTMYLLLPMVCWIQQRAKSHSMFALFAFGLCSISLWYARAHQPAQHPVFYGTDLISLLDVAPYFFLGALVRDLRLEEFLDPVFGLFLVIAVALIQPTGRISSEIALYVLVPYVTLAVALNANSLLSGVGKYGDFSYGIYLYGFLCQQIVNRLTHGQLGPWSNALLSLPPALLLAVLSWHFVEKPMLALKPRNSLSRKSDVQLIERVNGTT
ncbi:acyltransferase [Rhodanobacter sp. DHB23]|uniref:acyltransferase family protein n=1 Tax=Rhodanobacter sp. DHB23 TaxID=2775923 RepID=UPI00177E2AC6|nr:acyltransferase [Rhodanobacter sp. DHB23]MBD8873278.1 acyltransferase [Rhodanobacter sp. DHB23]